MCVAFSTHEASVRAAYNNYAHSVLNFSARAGEYDRQPAAHPRQGRECQRDAGRAGLSDRAGLRISANGVEAVCYG